MNDTLQLTLADVLKDLMGATVNVMPGTNFSQRVSDTELLPQPPAITFEPVTIVNAGDDTKGGFFVEVKRQTSDQLSEGTTFIFSSQNQNGIAIQAGEKAIVKDGIAYDLFPDGAAAAIENLADKIKTSAKNIQVGKFAGLVLLVLAAIGIYSTAKYLFKKSAIA